MPIQWLNRIRHIRISFWNYKIIRKWSNIQCVRFKIYKTVRKNPMRYCFFWFNLVTIQLKPFNLCIYNIFVFLLANIFSGATRNKDTQSTQYNIIIIYDINSFIHLVIFLTYVSCIYGILPPRFHRHKKIWQWCKRLCWSIK